MFVSGATRSWPVPSPSSAFTTNDARAPGAVPGGRMDSFALRSTVTYSSSYSRRPSSDSCAAWSLLWLQLSTTRRRALAARARPTLQYTVPAPPWP